MDFLVDADLPRLATRLLNERGHRALDVRDIGLRDASDDEIAHHARVNSLCLVTADFDFSDIRLYPPELYAGIVVLVIPAFTTTRYILDLLDRFVEQTDVLERLPGHLAIVEATRIRLRRS